MSGIRAVLQIVRTSVIPITRKWVSFFIVIYHELHVGFIIFREKLEESTIDSFRNITIIGKVKAHELRTKSKGELLFQLKELKEELSTVG